MKILCRIAALIVGLAFVTSVFCRATSVKDEEIEDKASSTTELSGGRDEDRVRSETTADPHSTTEINDLDEDKCRSMIGRFVDGKFEGTEVNYGILEVLEQHGGGPGRVDISWTGTGEAPVENPRQRPLPDAGEKYWIYNYRDSDNKTFLRTEHALARFSGVPNKAFVEFRGTILWTPADFCGKARRAEYLFDDRGFSARVTREHCTINQLTFSCHAPVSCKTVHDVSHGPPAAGSVQCGDEDDGDPLLFGGTE